LNFEAEKNQLPPIIVNIAQSQPERDSSGYHEPRSEVRACCTVLTSLIFFGTAAAIKGAISIIEYP
jgi:hypothetical protein